MVGVGHVVQKLSSVITESIKSFYPHRVEGMCGMWLLHWWYEGASVGNNKSGAWKCCRGQW